MAKKPAPQGLQGIEPSRLSVPAMDRPSLAFAWFLDSMVIDHEEGLGMVMACVLCGDSICDIEATDTLRVLLNTALAHTCGA